MLRENEPLEAVLVDAEDIDLDEIEEEEDDASRAILESEVG